MPWTRAKEIRAKSAVLADRSTTRFRELAEAQRKFNGSWLLDRKDDATRLSYLLLGMIQLYAVDYPTWQGAYEKALTEGMSEPDAILRADRDLLDAQGSGREVDLSGIERSSEGMKLLTVMYTFFNTTLNLAMQERYTDESKLKMIWRLFLILGIQSALDTALRNAFDKAAGGGEAWDDAKLYKKMLREGIKFNLGMFVGLRELTFAVDPLFGKKGYGYSGPTGTKLITDIGKLAVEIGQGEMDSGLLKASISVTGDALGLPSTEINRGVDAYNAKAPWWNYLVGVEKN